MITHAQAQAARERAAGLVRQAGVMARPEELARIEVVDLGLGELEETGLQILVI